MNPYRRDGSVYVFDDFREAYAWLRHNTHPESKVASWCGFHCVFGNLVWVLKAWGVRRSEPRFEGFSLCSS